MSTPHGGLTQDDAAAQGESAMQPVLVTGARGFVGSHLTRWLRSRGVRVRCGSRNVARAQAWQPTWSWVQLDTADEGSLDAALRGCRGAYFLVHQLDTGRGYPAREQQGARAFAAAAARAGVARIVYLGGVAPCGPRSTHLQSRLDTGAELRAGAVPTVELRAAMIIGAGSASWQMVQDLVTRLPAMLLPRWCRHHSWPVALDDVLWALDFAMHAPRVARHACYDLTGGERVSYTAILRTLSAQQGRHPWMIPVPWLTPRLSSYWLRLVTRTNLELAKELVQGLGCDLEPSERIFWSESSGYKPMRLQAAIVRALTQQDDPHAAAQHWQMQQAEWPLPGPDPNTAMKG
ncbi:MAG: NAD(P)H-binding protein [Polyangiales bacterium]